MANPPTRNHLRLALYAKTELSGRHYGKSWISLEVCRTVARCCGPRGGLMVILWIERQGRYFT